MGERAFPDGPPAWPLSDPLIRDALLATYADGSWGRYLGPHCDRLCQALRDMLAVEHVQLCASGTVAVEIALHGLRIEAEDEVILAGYDFSGNFRAIESLGARPVLVDIDPATWSLDAGLIDKAVLPTTKAIVASHLHGGLLAMRQLREVADAHGLCIVEDACQVPGAMVDGRPAGTWGDVGVFSFGGSKLLTAGRGGAVVTSRADVDQRARVFCERGNHAFPLSEIQAALLLPQLEMLGERNSMRRRSFEILQAETADLTQLTPLRAEAGNQTTYYKVPWLLCGDVSREEIIRAAQAQGVALDSGFRGFVRRSARRCRHADSLDHSRRAAESTLLLHHPVLLEEPPVIEKIAHVLHGLFVDH